jgi:PP-loop superfamily ATP-utilizing enzyme
MASDTDTSTDTEARLRAAERLLRENGYPAAAVALRGAAADIAAVALPRADFERITAEPEALRVTGRLRALGFRYVALDLAPREDEAAGQGGEP